MNLSPKQIAVALEKILPCTCNLDKWQPEPITGHSSVCGIHQIAVRPLKELLECLRDLRSHTLSDDTGERRWAIESLQRQLTSEAPAERPMKIAVIDLPTKMLLPKLYEVISFNKFDEALSNYDRPEAFTPEEALNKVVQFRSNGEHPSSWGWEPKLVPTKNAPIGRKAWSMNDNEEWVYIVIEVS